MTRELEKENHKYCEDTLALRTEMETAFLRIGERLYSIKQQRLYEPFWSSFAEYELEFKWSPGQVSRLINIYKRFVLEYRIAPAQLVKAGGWTVVAETLPVVGNKEEAKEWLLKAEKLSREDLREEVREARGKAPRGSKCPDKHAQAFYMRICPSCGLKERISPEEIIKLHKH